MAGELAGRQLTVAPTPVAYVGAGSAGRVGGIVTATGARATMIVTDAALARTGVPGAVRSALEAEGLAVTTFTGVHANPTTGDIADGAASAAALLGANGASDGAASRLNPSLALVPVGGGSAIDAAKGIALAAVNPERGRDLDYRREFRVAALPIVAVPTTAGTGAETNPFGVITDPERHRKFYVGHASTLPVAAILDPELTTGLPPGPTAATGMDALIHAIESYLSVRANPWAAGIALQVIRMVSAQLPRACADGTDLEARAQMLLAAHMAGIAMATTGLGLCHAIGHAVGARHDLPHGVALGLVLPQVLEFSRPGCDERLADIAFALGVGSTGKSPSRNAAAAIDAVAALREEVRLPATLAAAGVAGPDIAQLAADALDDEVLANTPRQPASHDIEAILGAG
jgi:alcohol dehydrogenase